MVAVNTIKTMGAIFVGIEEFNPSDCRFSMLAVMECM
jgi:hypothetical protein